MVRTAKILLLSVSLASILSSCARDVEKETMEKVECLAEMTELGTVEYTVKKIISVDDAVWYKYGDRKLLFSSVAYLKAGIDMSGFKPENVKVDTKNSTIAATLPKAKLLSFNMPLEEIKQEYSRVSKLRFDFTPEERLDLKQQGEKAIREEISSLGILNEAEKNAEDFFTAVFTQLGYRTITVKFE